MPGGVSHSSPLPIHSTDQVQGSVLQSRLKIMSDGLPWTRMTQQGDFKYRMLMQRDTYLVEIIIFETIHNIFTKPALHLALVCNPLNSNLILRHWFAEYVRSVSSYSACQFICKYSGGCKDAYLVIWHLFNTSLPNVSTISWSGIISFFPIALMLISSKFISLALTSHRISDLYFVLPMEHRFISQISGNHPKLLYVSNLLYPSHKDLFIITSKYLSSPSPLVPLLGH